MNGVSKYDHKSMVIMGYFKKIGKRYKLNNEN